MKGGYNKLEQIFSLFNFTSFDSGVATEFNKMLLILGTIIACIAVILGVLYIFKYIVFKIYCRCSNKTVQDAVTSIIYQLDELADNMSKKDKRKEAISAVKDLFIWRNIPIPNCIIGIIIDLEVRAIRKLQASIENEKDPYLHDDNEDEESDNTEEIDNCKK